MGGAFSKPKKPAPPPVPPPEPLPDPQAEAGDEKIRRRRKSSGRQKTFLAGDLTPGEDQLQRKGLLGG